MYELIEHKKLDSPATSITFSNIAGGGTDLFLVFSLRSDAADGNTTLSFNGSTANFSVRTLFGSGSGVGTDTSVRLIAGQNPSNHTANTFASAQLYIPNYAGSTNKSFSFDGVQENNATGSYQNILTGLWSQTAAINSITLTSGAGNFVIGSSATLYKVNRTSAIGKPKAIGGNITYSNGYWVHTFTGSGTFSSQRDLAIDALVVAGGAGGAGGSGGGGGAGGMLVLNQNQLTKGSYPVLVGSGGQGGSANNNYNTANGTNSTFLNLIAVGGGRGAGQSAGLGGSGGGGRYDSTTGGAGTAGQGNAGGNAVNNPYAGAGGGGAGSAGGNVSSANGAPGGNGLIWGTAYYAGGGGGGADSYRGGIGGAAGLGGGGRGANYGEDGTSGTANTGGGGGGGQNSISPFAGGNGGSGVVIIRYRAD